MTAETAANLAALVALGQGWIEVAAMVFIRIGAVMALLPAFGEHSVPVRVRLGTAIAFTLIVAPAVAPALGALAEAPNGFLLALASEPLAGFAIGFGLRLFVMALQIAGTIAAQATSLAQFFGGAGADPQPAISQILVMAGLALALAAGFHLHMVELLILSYDVLPPGGLAPGAEAARWATGHVARIFALAFALSAPFVIAALIYNLALGAINRAMPQLMVILVGAPALTGGGLILLALAAPAALQVWLGALGRHFELPFAAP